MSIYGAVADGAQTVRRYHNLWHGVALSSADAEPHAASAADLQKRQLQIIKANQELTYANDVFALIIKSLRDLQP